MEGRTYTFKTDMDVTLLNPNEKVVGKEDWEIGKHYFRVKTAEAIEKAQVLADSGKHEQAKQILQTMINTMKASNWKTSRIIQDILIRDLEASLDLNTAAMR
jgi:hypothetical protein